MPDQTHHATTLIAPPRGVANLLRVEGGVTLIASVLLYRWLGGGWGEFAALFLLPDLSMIGYLRNPRVGAGLYNAGHALLCPALLAAVAWGCNAHALYGPALIWVAHIGFDRLMGYGLKYPEGFGATHLGMIGAARRARGILASYPQ